LAQNNTINNFDVTGARGGRFRSTNQSTSLGITNFYGPCCL